MKPSAKIYLTILFFVFTPWLGFSAIITVTSIADTGPGSLRDAILAANSTTAADIIEFKIQPGGPQHILLNSVLPQINRDLTISGSNDDVGNPI